MGSISRNLQRAFCYPGPPDREAPADGTGGCRYHRLIGALLGRRDFVSYGRARDHLAAMGNSQPPDLRPCRSAALTTFLTRILSKPSVTSHRRPRPLPAAPE